MHDLRPARFTGPWTCLGPSWLARLPTPTGSSSSSIRQHSELQPATGCSNLRLPLSREGSSKERQNIDVYSLGGLSGFQGALPFPSATHLRESARVQIAAPNNTTSLTRNWPGDAERAGNPYPACHTPGVVMTKLSVVKNIPIPPRLPTIESFGQTGPAAISNAMAISTRPRPREKSRTSRM